MKGFVLFLFAVLAVAFVAAEPPHHHHHPPHDHHWMSPEEKKYFEECKEEMKGSSHEMDSGEKHGKKMHCIKACVMEKSGQLKDGKLEKEVILENMKKKQEKFQETLETCIDKVNEENIENSCKLAGAMKKCMHEAFKKQ